MLHNHQKIKWKFNPTTVHHKKYIFTVVEVTNASEYGMIKSSMKSDLIWCNFFCVCVKVLLFLVVDKPLIIFTDSCFSIFFYWVFQRIGFVTFWSIKKYVPMLCTFNFQGKSIINNVTTFILNILLYYLTFIFINFLIIIFK